MSKQPNRIEHKYHYKTRNGNWSEEWELDVTKKKDPVIAKDNKFTQIQAHLLQKASITYSKDSFLHYDDHITLVNGKTKSILASNILETTTPQNLDQFPVSTSSKIDQPITRSIFVFQRYGNKQLFKNDNRLHYGEEVVIQANPRLSQNKLYLMAKQQKIYQHSKFSEYKDVFLTSAITPDSVWVIEQIDPTLRFEEKYAPVQANIPILIRHVLTGQWLASDQVIQKNCFGNEFEVFAFSFNSKNKTQNLIAEKEGRITIDETIRSQEEQNFWQVCTAFDPCEEFDEKLLDKATTASTILYQIRNVLLEKSSYSLRELTNIFKNICGTNNSKIEFDDFKWGLRSYGIYLGDDEIQLIFNEMDTDGNGTIDYIEFMQIFKGKISEQRKNLIQFVFNQLDLNKNGSLSFEEIAVKFNAAKHPEVLMKIKTEEQAFNQFMANWDKQMQDDKVTLDEFFEYYYDISCNIEKDQQFEFLLRSTWNI